MPLQKVEAPGSKEKARNLFDDISLQEYSKQTVFQSKPTEIKLEDSNMFKTPFSVLKKAEGEESPKDGQSRNPEINVEESK